MADEDNAATATDDAAETTRAAGEAFLAAPDETAADDWQPPQTREDGVAIDGDGLPINHRLRAIALAEKGESEDPAGQVSPEQIEDAGKRLAAYDSAYPKITGRMSRADLSRIAEAEGVDLSDNPTLAESAARITASRPAFI